MCFRMDPREWETEIQFGRSQSGGRNGKSEFECGIGGAADGRIDTYWSCWRFGKGQAGSRLLTSGRRRNKGRGLLASIHAADNGLFMHEVSPKTRIKHSSSEHPLGLNGCAGKEGRQSGLHPQPRVSSPCIATTDSVVQTSAPPHSLDFDRTHRDLPLLLSLCYAQPVTAPSFFFFLGFRFFTFPLPSLL